MRKVGLFVSLLIMQVFLFSSVVFAEIKMSVIDVNAILSDLPQIKAIEAKLKGKFDVRGQEIVKLQNTFRDNLEKYRQINTTLKGDDLKKAQDKIIDENKRLQDAKASLQQDLAAEQKKEINPVLQQIDGVVAKIAKDNQTDIIVSKTSTAYVNPKYEITAQVVAEMNKLVAKQAPSVNAVITPADGEARVQKATQVSAPQAPVVTPASPAKVTTPVKVPSVEIKQPAMIPQAKI
jgi:outer membrane protein